MERKSGTEESGGVAGATFFRPKALTTHNLTISILKLDQMYCQMVFAPFYPSIELFFLN